MNKNTKIILLSIISVLIIITIVLGITYSFMRPINETSSITSVKLESCANITLTDTGESINLSNSYPMTKNRAFETTPYTFTVSSSCTDGSGFNLYLATLNTNTLPDSSIHYIITEHGNKNVITEGILSEATNGLSDFQDYELDELNNGINGTYGSIYRLHSSGINYNTEVSYDLYLYIDESVTNETMGQTFSAGLAVKASDYDFATVDEVTVTETTTDSITVSVSASAGTNAIGTYYYSINNGAYTSSSSNTYTFSGLSAGTTYQIRVYVVDTNGVQSNVYNLSVQTDDTPPTLADTCRETGSNTLACHVATQYTTDGENGLYYHDADLANSAADNSYRYAGVSANVNNYVCFGSDAANCPSDNLYRIIGVFGNQVKLIKNTSIGNNYWSGSSSNRSNTWSSSTLNTGTLNGTYLSGLSSTWQNKIATTNWKVGGMSQNNSATAKQYYDTEIGSSSSSTTYSAKIGLMYVSDYGFAASPDYWTTELLNYESSKSSNWMNININEWTISRRSDDTYLAFVVFSAGYVSGYNDVSYNSFGVRPVFYLTSSTTYVSGSGSSADPIRVS